MHVICSQNSSAPKERSTLPIELATRIQFEKVPVMLANCRLFDKVKQYYSYSLVLSGLYKV
jgi:hypothetical protein